MNKIKSIYMYFLTRSDIYLPIAVLFLAQQIMYIHLSFTPLSDNYMLGGDLNTYHYLNNLFNADAYRAGMIPLWNPYIHSGFPWATGLEHRVFYPVEIIISFITGYSYNVMHVEFILTILFGGIGTFFLLQEFKLARSACYYGAISFFASGIFVGNSQYFGMIIVYSFTPWIFLQFYKLYKTSDRIYAFYGAIFLALTVTGGYPGTYIVLAYILAITSIGVIVISEQPRRMFVNIVIMVVVAMGLASIHLLQCFSGFSQLSAAAGVSYEMAVVHHNLAPIDLFTLMLPDAATNPAFSKGPEFSHSITMRNLHLGAVLPCLIFIALFFAKNKKLTWFIFGVSMILLLAAMGDETIVRPLTYKFLPALDKVRQTSGIFRGFAMFGFCIIAAFGFQYFFENKKSIYTYLPFFIIPAFLFLLIYNINLTIEQKSVLSQGLIIAFTTIVIFLIIFILFKKNRISEKKFTLFIVILLIFEFSHAIKVNSGTLWEYFPDSKKQLLSLEKSRDVKFENLWKKERMYQVLNNSNNYIPLLYRIPTDYGYSSSMLNYYQQYIRTRAYSEARSHNLENKIIVFPETLTYYERDQDVITHLNNFGMTSRNNAAALIKSQNESSGKTVNFSGNAIFSGIIKYTLNSIEFEYHSDSGRLAIFDQVYFPGWSAYIKETGEKVPVIKVNHSFIGLSLPSGSGTVVLEYAPRSFIVGLFVSLLFSVLTFSYLIYRRWFNRPLKIVSI